MSKRAIRRHHRARVVERAVHIRRQWWSDCPDEDELLLVAKKHADHLAACSCVSCGNPRRFQGLYSPVLTRQEQLSDLYLREALDELAVVSDDCEGG